MKLIGKKVVQVVMGMVLLLSVFVQSSLALAAEDIMSITREAGYQVDEKYRPKSSIMIDSETGQVMWEDQADDQRSIASLTKLMTVYLGFEAIESGKFSLETTVKPSDKILKIAQIYSLSNNKMVPGVEYSIEDIIHLVLIPSSNAATVMLANLVSDDDEALFINQMNEKAQELGMTNTMYYNATGAASRVFEGHYAPVGIDPDGDNVSTARDLSILVYNMLKKYPQILDFTRNPSYTVLPGTPYEETFETYLFALPGKTYAYEGFDGIKTGSSPSAAFGFAGTAKREETRLIEVILGVGDWSDQLGEEERHPFGNALLDRGFNSYNYQQVLAKGTHEINNQTIVLEEDFYALVPKNQEATFELTDNQLSVVSELPQVSDQIPAKSVTVEIKGSRKSSSSNKQSGTSNTPGKERLSWMELVLRYGVSVALIVLGLILLVLSRLQKKPSRGRRHRGKNKGGLVAFVLGSLVTISGIGMLVLTFLNLI